MKLEATLKQKDFKTPEERAMVNILFTAYRIKDRHQCMLNPHDISVQQYNILRILRGQYPGSASVNLLRDRMLDKNSGVSRMVEKLRLKGLVERSTHDGDRRQVDVCITKTGLKLLDQLDEEIKPLHHVARVLSAAELDQLNRYLDRIRLNFQT